MRLSADCNFDAIMRELGATAHDVINASNEVITNTAYQIEADAKSNIKSNKTVDTGRLLGSVTTKVNSNNAMVEAEIGTNVEYANYIEYGTSKMAAKPFLNPAFENNTQNIQREIENAVRNAFR